jgi:dipeptidase D
MTVLSSDTIAHPAVEAMFRIDEETGMTGAIHLDPSNFSGEILLNLDTEDDDEISIGCAGGIDTNTTYTCKTEDVKPDSEVLSITIKGLVGGHSGMDIDKERGNANKFMNRVLYHLHSMVEYQLISIDGGSLRNAIPRESTCVLAVTAENAEVLKAEFEKIAGVIVTEFKTIEENVEFSIQTTTTDSSPISNEDKVKILHALYAVHNGVYRMSPDIQGLVEASSSLARIIIKDGEFITQSLQRSSVESTKDDLANTIRGAFDLMGCAVVQSGDYPGWQPNKDSAILDIMSKLYRDSFNEEPKIKACHAGLECGILLKHLPEVDMISFGPNIRAAHSPDEKCQISSVQKYWGYLIDTLQLIPTK